jgi:hypothetical protein
MVEETERGGKKRGKIANNDEVHQICMGIRYKETENC